MSQSNEPSANIPFLSYADLAQEKLGGRALYANDEFFAGKENLLKPGRGVFIPDKYTEVGKWMDGWESRRKRVPGYDFCVIKLGVPGEIHGFNVDTNHFVGNYPEFCSIDCCSLKDDNYENAQWKEIVPKSRLRGGSENFFPISPTEIYTHVRLNIYPDGGVARFRVHGMPRPNWEALLNESGNVDLAALANGGSVVACNDMFFGSKENLIAPGRAATMGEGWETRRRRGPGFDWIVVKLAVPGVIEKFEVDTNHFKGNFPDTCSIEAAFIEDSVSKDPEFLRREHNWQEVLPKSKLSADTRHYFEKEIVKTKAAVNFVRLNIFPDGGVSRLRVFGKPDQKAIGKNL